MIEQEKQLIQKILKGDSSSFSYFIGQYQDMAYTIAFRICRNQQDAEDIVQMAFVRAYKNLSSFRATSKFSTWFYRIVYNIALAETQTTIFNTEFVDYHSLSESDNVEVDWNGISHMEASEKTAIVNRILDKLPKDEALILSLFYMEENSIKDVALMVGISEANVKVRLHRARKRFATLVEEYNLEPMLRY